MILYVRSERGAHSERPSRKLVSIHQIWRDMGYEVELICGADAAGPLSEGSAGTKRTAPMQFRSNPGLTGIDEDVDEVVEGLDRSRAIQSQ